MKSTVVTRRGFTMLEMAMVLAIIGLLLGGLIGIASYTKNARLSTMMNEGKYYINAFNQFQTRYGAPPGDYATASLAWTGAGNGDGNGLIRAAAVAVPLERYYAFQHLANAGFIQGKYTGAASPDGGATIGLNVPGTSVDKSAFLFDHPDATDGFVPAGDTTYFEGQYGNVLTIAGLNDKTNQVPNLPFLTPKEALRLDEKFDDGMPGMGTVVTPENTALSECASSNTTASATYSTNNAGKACYFFIKM